MKRLVLLIFVFTVVFCAAGCRGMEPTIASSGTKESETIRPRETERDTVPHRTESSVDPSEDRPSSAEPAEEAETALFLGKRMPVSVVGVNERTLADPDSWLYDLTAEPNVEPVFLALSVYDQILQYELPASGYLGDHVLTEELKKSISDERNLKALTDRIFGLHAASPVLKPKWGLLVQNADVRSFPTSERMTSNGLAEEHDRFQETVFGIAEGVIVLHESLSGEYFFCQGQNYAGWIRSSEIAFVSWGTFLSYLNPERFLVSFGTDASVSWNRLGLVLPMDSEDENHYRIVLPSRDSDGTNEWRFQDIRKDPACYHEGFLPYDAGMLSAVAEGLIGTPYGWGDEQDLYDCSSFAGLVYRCFGFYLPRNSSIMKYFGGSVLSLEGLSDAEKKEQIRKHPGAILVMSGHVMLYAGPHEGFIDSALPVLQQGTGWCLADGTAVQTNCVTLSDLHMMNDRSGNTYLSRILYLLWVDE